MINDRICKKIAVLKKCCKFAIYGILEQDQNIQIFETINPSILFMCPSSKRERTILQKIYKHIQPNLWFLIIPLNLAKSETPNFSIQRN
ncbi:hypothetical protein FF021_16835 [Leptospira noguchii]|nr:hypothetical protein FF021_16835 [Leptospira noguchii]